MHTIPITCLLSCFSALLLASAHPCYSQAFADDGLHSRSKVNAAIKKAERLWPSNAVAYFQASASLISEFAPLVITNSSLRGVLEEQARDALGKKASTNSTCAVEWFRAKEELASKLIELSPKPSASNIMALAVFLGEIRAATISNYHRRTVYSNISPPLQPTNTSGLGYFDGMNPDLIADRTARDAYIRARAENAENAQQNDLQLLVLPDIDQALSRKLLLVYRSALKGKSSARLDFEELSRAARLSQQEREAFR